MVNVVRFLALALVCGAALAQTPPVDPPAVEVIAVPPVATAGQSSSLQEWSASLPVVQRLPDHQQVRKTANSYPVESEGAINWKWYLAGVAFVILLLVIIGPSKKVRREVKLRRLRDAITAVVKDMPIVSASETELFLACSKMLPVVEREVGRANYRKTGDLASLNAKDRADAELTNHLVRAPLLMSDASSDQIASLFQSSRRPI